MFCTNFVRAFQLYSFSHKIRESMQWTLNMDLFHTKHMYNFCNCQNMTQNSCKRTKRNENRELKIEREREEKHVCETRSEINYIASSFSRTFSMDPHENVQNFEWKFKKKFVLIEVNYQMDWNRPNESASIELNARVSVLFCFHEGVEWFLALS